MDKIDFVITWVDGNDPAWQAEKAKYSGGSSGDARARRFRDWDNLQYWFRGVEKFAPWVNKIYFVTWGHIPPWLNTENPKLKIVKHEDFIPEKYLPTFSSRPIDFHFHKIEGLSEQFVYFNDDMFLLAPTQPEDFFKEGKPRDFAGLNAPIVPVRDSNGEIIPIKSLYTAMLYNTILINRNFDKKKVIRSNWKKWFSLSYGKNMATNLLLLPWSDFPGFRNTHLPYSFLKSTFEKVWEKEPEMLDNACSHKFRQATDVSSVAVSLWQICEGNFSPRPFTFGWRCTMNEKEENNKRIFRTIRSGKYKIVCVNDNCPDGAFEEAKKNLNECFASVLPGKSAFEK